MRAGTFRQDLYFRLNGMTVTVPPLRERKDDVRELALMFAARTSRLMGLPAPSIAPAALARLEAHSWPGNVRELRNAVDRAVTLAGESAFGADHLFFDDAPEAPAAPPASTQRAARAHRKPMKLAPAIVQHRSEGQRAIVHRAALDAERPTVDLER